MPDRGALDHCERKDRCLREFFAERHLGDVAEHPLVKGMLYWIQSDDLWMALESCGLVEGGTGRLVTPAEMVEQALAELQAVLARPKKTGPK